MRHPHSSPGQAGGVALALAGPWRPADARLPLSDGLVRADDTRPLPAGSCNPDDGITACELFRWYVRVLLRRFAVHGRSQDGQRCRCGSVRPCDEEQQIAALLGLAGSGLQ